jgi:hypothetical protein
VPLLPLEANTSYRERWLIQHRMDHGTEWTPSAPAFSLLGMRWRNATQMELESFLQTYPNPLEAQPPIERKARYREWCDATLGDWPDNVVAKCWARGRCTGFQIRILQDQISD